MVLEERVRSFIKQDVLQRFLRYVQVSTASDANSGVTSGPSTPGQWDLLRMLADELKGLGVADVLTDHRGYVYGKIPANVEGEISALGFLAHVDTSPDQIGEGVKPRVIENYDGSPIRYPDNEKLVLDTQLSPELSNFIGDNIVVASGQTLLGADDKAGVAEIMASVAAWQKFPELKHGEILVCFSRDEEIGRGVNEIDLARLPQFCFTLDGGAPGVIESECFDAWHVSVHFDGVVVHPGYAKGKLVNAAVAAARFVSLLPRDESPEQTEGRQGFFHVLKVQASGERATVDLILRDFERAKNEDRLRRIDEFCRSLEAEFPRLQTTVSATQSYQNMGEIISKHPEVLEIAREAIRKAGLTPIEEPIRGGTDGSRLSFMGHPTPNLFAGEMMLHSQAEWVAHSALQKATETMLYLSAEWVARSQPS